jgi:hypothetical protein
LSPRHAGAAARVTALVSRVARRHAAELADRIRYGVVARPGVTRLTGCRADAARWVAADLADVAGVPSAWVARRTERKVADALRAGDTWQCADPAALVATDILRRTPTPAAGRRGRGGQRLSGRRERRNRGIGGRSRCFTGVRRFDRGINRVEAAAGIDDRSLRAAGRRDRRGDRHRSGGARSHRRRELHAGRLCRSYHVVFGVREARVSCCGAHGVAQLAVGGPPAKHATERERDHRDQRDEKAERDRPTESARVRRPGRKTFCDHTAIGCKP